jgi:hypothetical protein
VQDPDPISFAGSGSIGAMTAAYGIGQLEQWAAEKHADVIIHRTPHGIWTVTLTWGEPRNPSHAESVEGALLLAIQRALYSAGADETEG